MPLVSALGQNKTVCILQQSQAVREIQSIESIHFFNNLIMKKLYQHQSVSCSLLTSGSIGNSSVWTSSGAADTKTENHEMLSLYILVTKQMIFHVDHLLISGE